MRIQIESNRSFLWLSNVGSNESKGFPLIAWDDVCRPKSKEGLGIRSYEDVNKATITKLGWRILTDNDSIWARIKREKYIKNNNFFRIPKKKGDSIVWREVINHRKYIGVGLKWCIGDGRKVYFQTDFWVYMSPLISFVDENHLHYINWYAKVYDFINQDFKEQNLQSISSILPLNVLADIKAIPIPSSPLCDRIFWEFSQDGKFTLKLATWAIRKPLMHPRSKIPHWIWNLNLMAKLNFFLWLVIRNALLTCEFLIARRMEISNMCCLCNHNRENIDHIFKSCLFIQGIWDRIKFNCPTSLLFEGDFFIMD